MVTRAQVERQSDRIEALAAWSRKRIAVIGPDESVEQALHRLGLSPVAAASLILIRTGVPRSQRYEGGEW
jgi:hypothetical protein